jgi:hypothetical protein
MMHTDYLNNDSVADGSVLFDDVRALDRLSGPDHEIPKPKNDVEVSCQLFDDIRAADRILHLCDAQVKRVSPAGQLTVQSRLGFLVTRNRCVIPQIVPPKGNSPSFLGQPADFGFSSAITHHARGPPYRGRKRWPNQV